MNARDYLKIMQRERLEQSQAVMLPLEEAKKIQKQIKSLQGYLDRSIKVGSTVLLDYLQKLEADKDFYINCALDIARGEQQLGFKVLETGDVGILALYAAKSKDPEGTSYYQNWINFVQAIRELKFESERKNR
ncbi:MAG: hypothetical protein D8B48_08880 [Granulicatella sp.]|nr:MAG: hypothetical protein D8B48_08880 [Granulicatella sp.]